MLGRKAAFNSSSLTSGAHEGEIDAKLFHRDGKEVECAAVDRGGADDVVARRSHVEGGVKVCRLAGGGEHPGHAALQRRDARRNRVVGGVLQAGVKVAVFLQVEEPAHLLARFIFIGRALHDRQHARLAVFRRIAGLDAVGVDVVVLSITVQSFRVIV